MYSKKVIELSGLVETTPDDEGNPQYIGTKTQWEKAERIQNEEMAKEQDRELKKYSAGYLARHCPELFWRVKKI